MKTKLSFVILPAVLLSISACKKEKSFTSNTKVFKVSVFSASLKTQLNGAMGYAFVINEDGQWVDSASAGIGAVNPGGGTTVNASVLHDINIASVTKALTGMAAVKLLDQKGISLNDSIGDWLPGYWQKSAVMSNITFRQLLTHTSGIRQSITSWDSLKATISGPLEGTKTYSYSNVNFALFRALLPKINNQATFNSNQSNSATFETWMSNQYISIMQQLIFSPAGIFNANCNTNLNTTTMQAFNELNNPPLIPRNAGDWTELCGGGGFYLSTMEMARFMAYLAHSEQILSASQKATMDNNLLGWDAGDSFSSTHGQVYGKDGALFWDNNQDNTISGGDSGLQTWVGKFPNGVELALSVTSIGNGWRSLSTIVQNAYEAAWVEE